MKKKVISVLTMLALIIGVSLVLAENDPLTETESYDTGSGSINWEKQTVSAVGYGTPLAKGRQLHKAQQKPVCLKIARMTAQRNLLEIVQGVQIDAESTVEDFMLVSDVVKTQVHGSLRGAYQVGQPRFYEDGSCELTLEVKLTGDLADAIIPKGGEKKDDVPTGPQKVYSGLIIDAKGLGAAPAMAPKVLDEGGEEVYSNAFVDRDYAIKQGVVGYSKSVEQAKGNERVGGNPLVLKAVKTSGDASTDLVISTDDAAKFKDANIDWGFLKECRVIIVL